MLISEPPCPQLYREWGQSPLHRARSGFTSRGACVGTPRHSSLPVLWLSCSSVLWPWVSPWAPQGPCHTCLARPEDAQ